MRALWDKAKAMWGEFSRVNAGTYASSISYYFFMSIIPLLVICVSLVSVVGISEQEVAAFFCELAPMALHDFVKMLVGNAFERSGVVVSLSTVMLLWSASKGITAFRGGLNAALGIEETQSRPLVIVRSIIAVIILGVLLAAVMYLVFSGSVFRALAGLVPGIQEQDLITVTLNSVATLVVGVVAITAFYAFLPDGKRSFKSQLPGGICATFACGVFSLGFRIYVDHFSNFTVLYGSLATVALFLFWMYLLFYILLASCFFGNYLIEKAGKR